MHGSAQPEDQFPPAAEEIAGRRSSGSIADRGNGSGKLEETELDSALQLLVERAQYITGATGTALALPQGDEMICRASAGTSAPAIGARLQVRSGLTGESIARRQLLRCDNAEADPRVNLEACRALGIASIVVLPLLRRSGEVRGLFELFSDHPYAFEERDLIALERMADLTATALDLAEQRQSVAVVPVRSPDLERPGAPPAASAAPAVAVPEQTAAKIELAGVHTETQVVPSTPVPILAPELPSAPVAEPEVRLEPTAAVEATHEAPVAAPVPEAMLRVQKCSSCGFPVSEGRSLCLDCEKKETEKKDFERKQKAQAQLQVRAGEQAPEVIADPTTPAPEEFVPAFLANSLPPSQSWLADHVNLLAIMVLILGILVAIVVFR